MDADQHQRQLQERFRSPPTLPNPASRTIYCDLLTGADIRDFPLRPIARFRLILQQQQCPQFNLKSASRWREFRTFRCQIERGFREIEGVDRFARYFAKVVL